MKDSDHIIHMTDEALDAATIEQLAESYVGAHNCINHWFKSTLEKRSIEDQNNFANLVI